MKKNTIFLLSLLTTATANAQIVRGDMNGDGKLNINDANAIVNVYIGGGNVSTIGIDEVLEASMFTGSISKNGVTTEYINGRKKQDTPQKQDKFPDVSGFENIIYPGNIELTIGDQKEISFYMKTNIDAVGYQFDMVLPDGVEIAWNTSYNDYAIEVGSLTTYRAHTIKAKKQADGSYRILCGNADNKTFTGHQGEVAIITLKISTATPGTYPLILKNIEIAKEGGINSPKVSQYEASLVVLPKTDVK